MLHIDPPPCSDPDLIALLSRRLVLFALAASLAFLGKETANILSRGLGVRRRYRREFNAKEWAILFSPLAAVLAWTWFYHQTGFWTAVAGTQNITV
jgi:hypothetical protein